MSVFNAVNPEVSSGALTLFGFHKFSQQTKTIFVNMIKDFFDYRNHLFMQDIPEIEAMQNKDPNNATLHVCRDFAAFQQKFPSIVVSLENGEERKAYIGSDNLVYTQKIETSSGDYYMDMYGGMVDTAVTITILAESSDQRSKIADLLATCFINYYRGQFIYTGEDGSQFIVCPVSNPVKFGSEQETTGSSPTDIIYVTTLSISCMIEYQFPSEIDGSKKYSAIKYLKGYGTPIEDSIEEISIISL